MFLTKLDYRAAVKGSRDPLGIQPIWTSLGRHVVGNLTTVSGTVTDFTTVLLGYYFADAVSQSGEASSDLDTFLKWEQLAGYARGAINGDWAFRGTERAKARHQQAKVTIGSDRDSQIMSDQKSYGLWGLYTSPSVASGFLEGSPLRLTRDARVHVESEYLPVLGGQLGAGIGKLVKILGKESATIDFKHPDRMLLPEVARIHGRKLTKAEIRFYDTHLVQGGPRDVTSGLQPVFADLLENHAVPAATFSWSRSLVESMAKAARNKGAIGSALSDRLMRIAVCESVMAPATAAFDYMLGMDDKPIDEAAQRLRDQWGAGLEFIDADGFAALRQELDPENPSTGDRWIQISRAAHDGDMGSYLDLLIQQNATVMAARGGAPWIEMHRGTLRVKFRDELGSLPSHKEAAKLWRHSYFLEPLRAVVTIIRAH